MVTAHRTGKPDGKLESSLGQTPGPEPIAQPGGGRTGREKDREREPGGRYHRRRGVSRAPAVATIKWKSENAGYDSEPLK